MCTTSIAPNKGQQHVPSRTRSIGQSCRNRIEFISPSADLWSLPVVPVTRSDSQSLSSKDLPAVEESVKYWAVAPLAAQRRDIRRRPSKTNLQQRAESFRKMLSASKLKRNSTECHQAYNLIHGRERACLARSELPWKDYTTV
jgi:hypothetical protein